MLLFDTIDAKFKPLVAHLQHASRSERSLALYKECIDGMELAKACKDEAAYVLIAQAFGLVIDQHGYSDASIEWLKDASICAQRIGEIGEAAHLMHLIGHAYYSRGEYQVALEHWTEGMQWAQSCEDHIGWAWCKLGVGQIADALDASTLAVQVFSELSASLGTMDGSVRRLPMAQRARFTVRLRELKVINTVNLAVNQLKLSQFEIALGNFERAGADARSQGLEDIAAECAVRCAEVAAMQNDIAKALPLLESAESALMACSHHWGLATLHLLRAQCLDRLHLPQKAMASANLARLAATQANAQHIALRIELEIANIAEGTGDLTLALESLKRARALQIALAQGSRTQTLRALQALAVWKPRPAGG